jgi:hypothetical protein
LPDFVARAKTGTTITIREPNNRIAVVHAHDLCRAALIAAEEKATGVFIISGSGPQLTMPTSTKLPSGKNRWHKQLLQHPGSKFESIIIGKMT